MGASSFGCDSKGAEEAASKAADKAKEAKKKVEAAVGGDTSPKPGVELAVQTPTVVRIWLKWDGGGWQYYSGPSASGNDDDAPPPNASWSNPTDGTIAFSQPDGTVVRALVHNTTGAIISATFEGSWEVAGGGHKLLPFSWTQDSCDDWDISVPPGDPVFHIKKGNTGTAGGACPNPPTGSLEQACEDCELLYSTSSGTPSWKYLPAGGRAEPISGAMTCTYSSATSELDVTVKNEDPSIAHTFVAEQTRRVGTTRAPVYPWNDDAWQLAVDSQSSVSWKVFVVGHQGTPVTLALRGT
ncbi:MAG: hypothetical protein AAF799_19485 [Myxococcota bacterium]